MGVMEWFDRYFKLKVKVDIPEKAGSEGRKFAMLVSRKRVFQAEKKS